MSDMKSGADGRLQPPYVSFQSVKTAISQFKEHVVPDRIDRSVLAKFSGSVGGQILTAFRFLGLTDGIGLSTDLMRTAVEAYGTDLWPDTLNRILTKAYAPIFELNLKSCSPNQFMEKFKATYSGAEDVTRKSVTFFLNASADAQIPISSFIMSARKPRSATVKRRVPKSSGTRTEEHEGQEELNREDDKSLQGLRINHTFFDKLMEKFPALDPAWPDEVKAKWFDAFAKLMESAEEQSK